MPTQQEEIKEQILEWNSYLPEVKKQSIDVLVANIISLAVAQREKEIVEVIEKMKRTHIYEISPQKINESIRNDAHNEILQGIINLITKPNDK